MSNTGVYTTRLKNGSTSYRVSITYRRKHISLGSFSDITTAERVYLEARAILDSEDYTPDSYEISLNISHDKYIILLNFRDNGIYFSTPIYLRKQYFEYYLNKDIVLKFDRDDLFFYASHKIGQRGGYLYISDYGSQYKLLGRYGIRQFAVYGRDYEMKNNDPYDFRYSNILIKSNYAGVRLIEDSSPMLFEAVIHVRGNYIVGRYKDEITAAIAYNKAVDTLISNGFTKNYVKNYIVELKKEEYLKRYSSVLISEKLYTLTPDYICDKRPQSSS